MRPLAGWLLDHKSRRTVVIVSLAALVLIPWFYVLTPMVLMLLISRTLNGIFSAMASTGITTNAYDTLNQEHFNEGVGYFGFSNAIATAIGPGFGLWLWKKAGAFVLFATISLVALMALLLIRKFHFHPIFHSGTFRLWDENIVDLLLERRALPASLLEGFVAICSGAITTYLAIYMEAQGGFANAGTYFAFQASGTFLSRLFVGKISDTYGESPLVWSSTFLFLFGILAITYSPVAWLVYLGAVCMGVGYGFTVTGLQIMSVRIVPVERRGAAASTYACAWDIFAAMGGLIAGALVTAFDYRAAFTILAMFYPAFLLTYVLKVSKHPSAFKVYLKNQK